jgi:predicted nucleic acid-binding protein
MPIDTVVVNASPLIILFRAGYGDLLPQLFPRIIVPDAVWTEVAAAGVGDAAANALVNHTWVQRQPVESSPRVLGWNLGAGETAVISHALKHPGLRAMLDDRAARRCARTLGVRTLGSGGTLVLAKRRGLLPSVADGLQRLRDAGLWIGDDVARLLLASAGEQLSAKFRGSSG